MYLYRPFSCIIWSFRLKLEKKKKSCDASAWIQTADFPGHCVAHLTAQPPRPQRLSMSVSKTNSIWNKKMGYILPTISASNFFYDLISWFWKKNQDAFQIIKQNHATTRKLFYFGRVRRNRATDWSDFERLTPLSCAQCSTPPHHFQAGLMKRSPSFQFLV